LSLKENCIYVLTTAQSISNFGSTGLPPITQRLTIKGNGATITRAQSAPSFRIFEVHGPAGDLTLSDLTVDNGDAAGGAVLPDKFRKGRGGGIYNLGTLKVINSSFSRNQASSGGGAIGNGDSTDFSPTPDVGDLTLSDGVLVDNTGDIGGAIANGLTSTMNLTGSTIFYNTGVSEGGGVATQGTAILNKCTISGNNHTGVGNVTGIGGGMVNGGQLFLTDSPVSGNTATVGGGIFNNGGQLFLTDSPVSGNNAIGSGTVGFGGGILNSPGGTANLTHSNITGNSATNGGGGMVNVVAQGKFGIATLTDSDVTGNSTKGFGAGILNGGHMTLTHSNITGNNATGDGGGVYNATERPSSTNPHPKPLATLTLTHTGVTGNNAGSGQHGGGIFNDPGNTVTLNQSTVTGNTPDDF
jgi:hypothetical protein